jgi:hypothetical protein
MDPQSAAPATEATAPAPEPVAEPAAPEPKPTEPPVLSMPLVTVVDFHHARGPETEMWFGAPAGTDPGVDYDWPLLPFMALSDGAHA